MAKLGIAIAASEIIGMHDQAISMFGGMTGIRINGCVDSAIELAMTAEYYSGSDDGTLGLCFIGSLMFYLNKNQCFMDGNKRTSMTAALKLLGYMGLTLSVSPKELEDYCVEIAKNTALTSNDVVKWLGDKIVTESG